MSDYLNMRRNATILRDDGDYNLAAAQMNPVIFEEFVGFLLESELPPVVWEPFAGQIPKSPFLDFAEGVDVTLLAQTLNPVDSRILAADSMVTGPIQTIGGMLFHPPYYASAPMSQDSRDVVLRADRDKYIRRLQAVSTRADARMAPHGLVCAIGRDYRMNGKRVHLDLWLLEMFRNRGYSLVDVWSSEPDIVLILRRKI